MTGETTYLIVPFDLDADGKLQPGAPIRLATEDAAEFAARLVERRHAGIIVIEEPVDAFEEPRLGITIGHIPTETLAIFTPAPDVGKRRLLLDQLRDFVNQAGLHDVEIIDPVSVIFGRKKRALQALSGKWEWRLA